MIWKLNLKKCGTLKLLPFSNSCKPRYDKKKGHVNPLSCYLTAPAYMKYLKKCTLPSCSTL